MSTVRSWTEDRLVAWTGDVRDLRALLRFRAAGLRGASRRVAAYGATVVVVLTVAAAWLPAYLPNGNNRRGDVMSLLPTGLFGVLLVSIIAAAAGGGGRELVPRDQAVAFPVTPTTDHLGALLMAPLNIAWLLQSWTLLGAVAYVAGPTRWLLLGQLIVLAWLLTATALGQLVGWAVEWLRRGSHGTWWSRGLLTGSLLLGAWAVASHRLVPALERSPTVHVTVAALQGTHGVTAYFVGVLATLLTLTLAAVLTGAWLAARVAERPPREELRLETSVHRPRSDAGSDLIAMIRVDRVGIWRSVPLRRGLVVLGLMPGLVAIAGDLQWEMLTILPGLVASGGALLFGVNSWCLDGRGALWRDSLPVDARLAFCSRVLVLAEVLLVATVGTLLLASMRAGLPTAAQLSAVGSAGLVVVVQVVSASLRWSVRRPFAVDLRSARATPAPPLVMVGYSARLALSTTLVGILFSVLVHLPWEWPVLVATVLVLFSAWRLVRTAEEWADPVTRCRVVSTVAS